MNRRTSNSGLVTRFSHSTKITYSGKLQDAKSKMGRSVITDPPLCMICGIRVIARSTNSVAAARKNAPNQSIDVRSPLGIGLTTKMARIVANPPMTPKMANTDLHPRMSRSGPPPTTPRVGAPVIANWNQPTAFALCSTPKACINKAIPLGMSNAPLVPNRTLTAMNVPMFQTQ